MPYPEYHDNGQCPYASRVPCFVGAASGTVPIMVFAGGRDGKLCSAAAQPPRDRDASELPKAARVTGLSVIGRSGNGLSGNGPSETTLRSSSEAQTYPSGPSPGIGMCAAAFRSIWRIETTVTLRGGLGVRRKAGLRPHWQKAQAADSARRCSQLEPRARWQRPHHSFPKPGT